MNVFAVAGPAFFEDLVAGFYRRVEHDPVLRPLYPGDDLAPAAERLRLFLIQYWGGPPAYSIRRGHPRLRMRHAPFAVDEAAHDAWLAAMGEALDEAAGAHAIGEEADAALRAYFVAAARAMVNVPAS